MSDRDDRTDDDEVRDDRVDDAETRESRPNAETREGRSGEGGTPEDGDDRMLSSGVAILIASLVGFAVAVAAYWWAGGWAGNEVFFEELYRVQPTVEGGGVGTDWVVGNTVPWLDALIAIVHAADVLMGVFILAMVFLHWAMFRRLADRMQPPMDARTGEAVATDGGDASRKGGKGGKGGKGAKGGDQP